MNSLKLLLHAVTLNLQWSVTVAAHCCYSNDQLETVSIAEPVQNRQHAQNP